MRAATIADISRQVDELDQAGRPFLARTGRNPFTLRHVTEAGRAVEITADLSRIEAGLAEGVAELVGLDPEGHPIGVIQIVDSISGRSWICSPMVRLQ